MGNIRYKGMNYTRRDNNPPPDPNTGVTFIDYDGTVIKQYTKEKFLSLNELPANPTHQGLVAQGWNWDLADAKEYVEKYGLLIIGQTYTTDDGKSRFVIRLEEGRLSPRMGFGLNGTAIIDWGDGSETTTLTGTNVSTVYYTQNHTYPSAGEYTISVEVSGNARIMGGNNCSLLLTNNSNEIYNYVYANSLIHCVLSSYFIISANAFVSCCSLSNIVLSQAITTIPSNAFRYCYSLQSVIIPKNVTSVDEYSFSDCGLISISMSSSITSIKHHAFQYCNLLTNISIPDTSNGIGGSAFYNNRKLHSIILPANTVTNSMSFYGCYALSSVIITNGVSSIGSMCFFDCRSLVNIYIPKSVVDIYSSAFANCSGLGLVKFESQTPPTIGSNVFSNIPTDCKILVPQGTIEAYKATPNMPNPSIYTYEEY